ncbi:hypothetical protein A1O1_08680 [Capronia coronata CBS 617.96]|uniref:Uncharacterized protein n=1 Tax=Capronia coronata CBS 617.96 TaxID=1182541 RepID=W9YDZ4_9EURO|nr:uncharacterized protein A1O1_08680 [Capronia coronata CBS 617.96]EXJ80534.1 hypothetical protein A1O1_08680 [Capronia coronata CBS 617.96]
MPTSRPQADLSPSAAAFIPSTSNPVASGSVRRNLFSAHLSRRPASSSRPHSQNSSQSQSNPQPAAPRTTRDRQQQQQQQHIPIQTHAHARNYDDQHQHQHPHALPQVRTHQRSVSTPSLSPSPPRLSPSSHVSPEPAAFMSGYHQHQSPPYPQLQTQQQHHALPPSASHRAFLTEGYDPTISPNRPLSPRSSATLFPNSSIIALNPVTGRPVLHRIPKLPGRLRLSDSDDGQDAGEDEDEDLDLDDADHYIDEDEAVAQAYRRGRRADPVAWRHNTYGHASSVAAAAAGNDRDHVQAAAAVTAEADAEADEERRDRERIERLLREMMARQRARAQSKSTSVPTGPGGDATSSRGSQLNLNSNSHSHLRGGRRRRRDMGTNHDNNRLQMQRGQDTGMDHAVESIDYFDVDHDHDHDHDDNDSSSNNNANIGPSYGERRRDSEAEAEREELMGLIVGSLRREIARADEEAWMFGEQSTMGAGAGRVEIGVYD